MTLTKGHLSNKERITVVTLYCRPEGHPICQESVATLERRPLVRGRRKYIYSRSSNNLATLERVASVESSY